MSVSGISSSVGYSLNATTNQAQQKDKPTAEEAFARMDADGDSFVSQAEMATMFEGSEAGQMSDDQMSEMFSEADTDGDGVLSEAEFATQMEAMEEQGPPQGMGPPPEGMGPPPEDMATEEETTSMTVDLSQVSNLVNSSSTSGAEESQDVEASGEAEEEEELTEAEILANQLSDPQDLDGDGEVSSAEATEYEQQLKAQEEAALSAAANVIDPAKQEQTESYQMIQNMAFDEAVDGVEAIYA